MKRRDDPLFLPLIVAVAMLIVSGWLLYHANV